MSNQDKQVKDLQKAMLKRAHELSEELMNEAYLTQASIMKGAREKVKLMEQKELLFAKDNAEREYQRSIQSSELRLKAELDRNRWQLVQDAKKDITDGLIKITADRVRYKNFLLALIKQAAAVMGEKSLLAEVNASDYKMLSEDWSQICSEFKLEIKLSQTNSECSGGVRMLSVDGNTMVNNTFEGILLRRDDEVMRVISERLFSGLQSTGRSING